MSDQTNKEVTLLMVEFVPGGRTYSYISESDSFSEGDIVVVRAGKDNHESTVRIVSKECCPVDDLPFPLERIKHVLRRATENEIAAFKQSRPAKPKKKTKQTEKEVYKEEPYISEGTQPDGSLVLSYADYGVESFGSMDYEVTYKLDPANTEKLREYLSKRHTGSSIESLIEQECGGDYRKKGPMELFKEAGVAFTHFVWIS